MPNHIICISGPEGVGKDTLLRPMLDLFPELTVGRKVTTRERRDDDYDAKLGRDKYDYTSEDEFMWLRSTGQIVEHSRNANGCLYGSQIDADSDGVELRDIDVTGALQLVAKSRLQTDFPEVTLIGILPPHDTGLSVQEMRYVLSQTAEGTLVELPVANIGVAGIIAEMLLNLEARLVRRGDSTDLREQKLERARWEVPEIIRAWPHVVVNDSLDLALAEMSFIIGGVLAEACDCARFRACSG